MIKKKIIGVALFVALIGLTSLSYCSRLTAQEANMVNKAYTVEDIVSLFALSAHDIMSNTDKYIDQAQHVMDYMVAINDDERTFENTVKILDELVAISDVAIMHHVCEALELLSPSEGIRTAAHDAYLKIQPFWVEYSANKRMYHALLSYDSMQKENEHLSDEQRYTLNEALTSFKRGGLWLPDDVLEQVKALKNELSVLYADFDRNIAQDNRSILVERQALDGLDDDFIASLERTESGHYSVGVDYPTYFRVMDNCTVTDTRRKLYTEFNNRAYPANDLLLKQIIIKRDELARLLGYIDFAHCNIDSQMVQTPERAQSFINDLIERSLPKVMAEKQMLTAELPESVQLTNDGTFAPWDFAFVANWYKKKHFNIDEELIADYFPMEKTVAELLDIYRQFFSIDFKQVPAQGLWHEDVSVVQVMSNTGELLGTLLLDLHPRPNKYSHAAHMTVIPGTWKKDGTRIPDVSIVLANFTKPTENKPSLLKRNEVQTFFHEFGHALHAILGATHMVSLSGTRTKTDFVELPSQMLEEWLWNKEILKKVSGHYQTGESLPDDIIDTLIAAKDLTSGYWVLRQAYLSLIALSYFGPGENKEPYSMMQELHKLTMANIVSFSPDNHFYVSFGHLTGYGARYYGYLWSKVFALDIFAEIKEHGLLDPVIGQKYVKEILSKGGAQDPNELLYNFLGREPNAQAFFAEMGL